MNNSTNKKKKKKKEKKKKKKKKKLMNPKNIKEIRENILYNYKGDFSLCFCCNLCNNKKENLDKFFDEQLHIKNIQNIEDMSENNISIDLNSLQGSLISRL